MCTLMSRFVILPTDTAMYFFDLGLINESEHWAYDAIAVRKALRYYSVPNLHT